MCAEGSRGTAQIILQTDIMSEIAYRDIKVVVCANNLVRIEWVINIVVCVCSRTDL